MDEAGASPDPDRFPTELGERLITDDLPLGGSDCWMILIVFIDCVLAEC
jgi:hypothetical protein